MYQYGYTNVPVWLHNKLPRKSYSNLYAEITLPAPKKKLLLVQEELQYIVHQLLYWDSCTSYMSSIYYSRVHDLYLIRGGGCT